MTTPLETFEQQLARFGLLEPEQAAPIKARLRAPEGPQGAQEFARELIRAGLLTKYQAVRTIQGHAKELVLGQLPALQRCPYSATGSRQILGALRSFAGPATTGMRPRPYRPDPASAQPNKE